MVPQSDTGSGCWSEGKRKLLFILLTTRELLLFGIIKIATVNIYCVLHTGLSTVNHAWKSHPTKEETEGQSGSGTWVETLAP